MAESRKTREYRETLHEIVGPHSEERRKVLEGKAAKLGAEIQGDERKGRPKTKLDAKPRR